MNYLARHAPFFDDQPPHRDRKLKTARTNAPWIQVKHAFFCLQERLVLMPGDDCCHLGSAGLKIEIENVV